VFLHLEGEVHSTQSDKCFHKGSTLYKTLVSLTSRANKKRSDQESEQGALFQKEMEEVEASDLSSCSFIMLLLLDLKSAFRVREIDDNPSE